MPLLRTSIKRSIRRLALPASGSAPSASFASSRTDRSGYSVPSPSKVISLSPADADANNWARFTMLRTSLNWGGTFFLELMRVRASYLLKASLSGSEECSLLTALWGDPAELARDADEVIIDVVLGHFAGFPKSAVSLPHDVEEKPDKRVFLFLPVAMVPLVAQLVALFEGELVAGRVVVHDVRMEGMALLQRRAIHQLPVVHRPLHGRSSSAEHTQRSPQRRSTNHDSPQNPQVDRDRLGNLEAQPHRRFRGRAFRPR
eukprot:scaffold2578_cov230-Pinguiococcus_pyrenoidosus.AAC.3